MKPHTKPSPEQLALLRLVKAWEADQDTEAFFDEAERVVKYAKRLLKAAGVL